MSSIPVTRNPERLSLIRKLATAKLAPPLRVPRSPRASLSQREGPLRHRALPNYDPLARWAR